MQSNISWRHMEGSPAITAIINEKLLKLEKCSERLSSIDIIIAMEGNAQRNSHRESIELQIKMRKMSMFIIKEEGYDLQAMVDECFDIAKRKIKELESKVRDTRRK
ncbi:MAG: HPF/RaiA family ribosome-associated protein [bacterium]